MKTRTGYLQRCRHDSHHHELFGNLSYQFFLKFPIQLAGTANCFFQSFDFFPRKFTDGLDHSGPAAVIVQNDTAGTLVNNDFLRLRLPT